MMYKEIYNVSDRLCKYTFYDCPVLDVSAKSKAKAVCGCAFGDAKAGADA